MRRAAQGFFCPGVWSPLTTLSSNLRQHKKAIWNHLEKLVLCIYHSMDALMEREGLVEQLRHQERHREMGRRSQDEWQNTIAPLRLQHSGQCVVLVEKGSPCIPLASAWLTTTVGDVPRRMEEVEAVLAGKWSSHPTENTLYHTCYSLNCTSIRKRDYDDPSRVLWYATMRFLLSIPSDKEPEFRVLSTMRGGRPNLFKTIPISDVQDPRFRSLGTELGVDANVWEFDPHEWLRLVLKEVHAIIACTSKPPPRVMQAVEPFLRQLMIRSTQSESQRRYHQAGGAKLVELVPMAEWTRALWNRACGYAALYSYQPVARQMIQGRIKLPHDTRWETETPWSEEEAFQRLADLCVEVFSE